MSWCHCTENGHKKSLKAIQSFDRWRNWGQKKVSELQQWIHVFWAQFSGSFCCTSVSQQAKSTARERLYGQTPDITQFYPQIMQVSNFYLFICPELPRIYFCFTNRDFAHFCINACMLSSFSCPTLCDPMDCSPPCSSVLGILQTRIMECVAMPFSRGSSQSRD